MYPNLYRSRSLEVNEAVSNFSALVHIPDHSLTSEQAQSLVSDLLERLPTNASRNLRNNQVSHAWYKETAKLFPFVTEAQARRELKAKHPTVDFGWDRRSPI